MVMESIDPVFCPPHPHILHGRYPSSLVIGNESGVASPNRFEANGTGGVEDFQTSRGTTPGA